MSILKRIEDIVLAAEWRHCNLNQAEANPSESAITEEQTSPDDRSAEPERNLQMELDLVEC